MKAVSPKQASPSVYAQRTIPTEGSNENSSANASAIGTVVGGFLSGFAGAVCGAVGGGLFGSQETDGARAAGRAAMTPGSDWTVPDAWWEKANEIEDPEERAKTIGRLQEIQSLMDLVGKYFESYADDPQMMDILMTRLLPQKGDMEDGGVGSVIAVVMSGQTELLPQLMGDDGGLLAFGTGDGLDDDEWAEAKDKFFKDLGELKQTFDLKLPDHGDRVFDYYQSLKREHHQSRHPGEADDSRREAEEKRDAVR